MCQTNHNTNTHKKQADSCNTADHKKWNRRSFLQALGLAGGGSMMLANTPLSVSRPSPLSIALSQAENDNILIICRLQGGNDGFNTIIPVYDYDVYANARPLIKIPPSEFIRLDDDFSMPKPMNKLESVWGDGQMKVVHGVGYEDSSLSHFKGSDIYANTNLVEDDRTGFMGRYFQEIYPDYFFNPPASPPSIQIGSIGNLIFRGPESNFSFAVSDPRRLLQIIENETFYNLEGLDNCTYDDRLRFLREATNTTFNYADVISAAYERSGPNDFAGYIDDSLGRQFSIISRLIKGNLGTKVYLVTLGGFDTHNNQPQRHQELLNSFSEAVSTFYKDLTAAGWDDKVLTMTISEFGRRFRENGSLGTDHGTAAPTMFFGSSLNGSGFVGEHPDLNDLTRGGNVTNTMDFRQVYATVMKEWLCIDQGMVGRALLGEEFESLDLGFNCSGSSINPVDGEGLTHIPSYSNSQTFINIVSPQTTHIDVSLYNIIGQKVATLANEMLMEGVNLNINVKESASTRLSTGPYVYQIQTNNGNYSKSIVIS